MNSPEPGDHSKLDAKFAGGVAWTAGVKWSTQIFTWGSLLIVARLLSTADYGVGEMAGTLLGLSNVLAEFGVGTAVLHMPELRKEALAQLHLFSCLLCGVIFLAASAASPFVAAFYHSPHLAFFLTANILLFLTGFEAVPMGLLQRDMDYRRLAIAEASLVMVQASVMVVTAWLGMGYWALLLGAAAGRATQTILVCSWKHVGFAWPRWNDIRAPVEMGRQAAIGRTSWSLYNQADGIVVGRILGAPALGIYRMAMNLASSPAEKIGTLLMRTASPLFANVKDDPALVRRYYLITVEILTLVVMPSMAGLALVAKWAVPLLLGQKWAAAAAPVQWLAIFMILRSMGTLTEQVLISQRMTRFTMRMSMFNLVVMPLAFIAAARLQGMVGVAAAWVVLSPLTIVPLVIVLLRKIQLPPVEFVRVIWPALAGTAAMSLAVFFSGGWLERASWPAALRVGMQVGLGGAVYSGVLLVFFRGKVVRYVSFLANLRKRSR